MMYALTDAAWTTLGVVGGAAVTAMGGVMIAMLTRQGRETKKIADEQQALKAKIQTNHGLEPYQYLEMVGALATEMGHQDRKLTEFKAETLEWQVATDEKLDTLLKLAVPNAVRPPRRRA